MWNRWLARGVMAGLLASVGPVAAQNSPTMASAPAALAQPRPTPATIDPPQQPIVRMRTAGQPDRQLKILRQTSYSDGETVAEVQDVQTGQIFTLPGKVVAMLPKEAGILPQAPHPTPAPPAFTNPVATAAVTPPAALAPTPATPTKPAPALPKVIPTAPGATKSFLDEQPQPRVIYIPPPPLDEVPVAKPAVKPEVAPVPTPKVETLKLQATKPEPKAEFAPASAVVPQAPASAGEVQWRPRVTEVAPPPARPNEVPKPDRWTPMRRFNPDPNQSLAPGTQTIVRGTHYTGHEETLPIPMRPRVVEDHNEMVPVAYRSLDRQIRDETQGYCYELTSALRPSVRENAAICLAESRYGWRHEVKDLLARAAITDPAASVRAKCIELLMQLGYHDPDYMEFLRTAATPGQMPPIIGIAAKEALAKLQPRGK